MCLCRAEGRAAAGPLCRRASRTGRAGRSKPSRGSVGTRGWGGRAGHYGLAGVGWGGLHAGEAPGAQRQPSSCRWGLRTPTAPCPRLEQAGGIHSKGTFQPCKWKGRGEKTAAKGALKAKRRLWARSPMYESHAESPRRGAVPHCLV